MDTKRMLQSLIFFCWASLIAAVANAGNIRVYAASSMTDALTEIAREYEQSTPPATITFSFASSSTLAKQIENGAPADIFVSADQGWVDYLLKKQQSQPTAKAAIEPRIATLVNNELVLVAHVEKFPQSEVDENSRLAAQLDGRLCIGDPAHVPAGKYAKEALSYLGWWNEVQPKLVGTEDVRSALAFVERGECAMGIVYKSDAGLSDRVNVIYRFPIKSHSPIRYPALLMNNSSKDALAFWQYLQSEKAMKIFIRYGFLRPSPH